MPQQATAQAVLQDQRGGHNTVTLPQAPAPVDAAPDGQINTGTTEQTVPPAKGELVVNNNTFENIGSPQALS